MSREGVRLGLTPQVMREFLHIVTDSRRFEYPLSMPAALEMSRELWHSGSSFRALPDSGVHDALCDLMSRLRLGRKRILDTSLAVTLRSAGIRRLATSNSHDFRVFPFLEIVDPLASE